MNDEQAIDAIDGLYAPIHQEKGFGRELFWEQGAACDIVWAKSRGFNSLATFNYNGDESPISGGFDLFYQNMARSNWIIKQLLAKEKKGGLSDVEHRSLGEAFFMRGMAHFGLLTVMERKTKVYLLCATKILRAIMIIPYLHSRLL